MVIASFFVALGIASGFLKVSETVAGSFKTLGIASGIFEFLGFAAASFFVTLEVLANVFEDLLVCTDTSNFALR